jgi:hypothetical protein
MKYLTIILLISSCSPVPSRVATEFKTGEEGEYQGTDVSLSWDL